MLGGLQALKRASILTCFDYPAEMGLGMESADCAGDLGRRAPGFVQQAIELQGLGKVFCR